jgi:outer membrane protein assembly factor BamB
MFIVVRSPPMKPLNTLLGFSIAGIELLLSPCANAQAPSPVYSVSQIFHPGSDGGWDYLTVDSHDHRLFVPRVKHTQVLDAKTGAVIADIPGQKHNHGVAIATPLGRGFISDGEDGSVVVFDLKTYMVLGKIKAEADADGIIYDPYSGKVLVACGDAGALVPIDADIALETGTSNPEIDLGGKPEFLAVDSKGRAYVNLEDKDLVAVVDLKSMKVIAKWSTLPGGSPVGLSIDPVKGHLFVGCRKPQKLIVMSTEDGKVLSDIPIGAGVDATVFDGDAFASCRDGTLTVAREASPGKFELSQTVHTALGARTMGVDTATHSIYLPTAEFGPAIEGKRPMPLPGSFKILKVDANSGH